MGKIKDFVGRHRALKILAAPIYGLVYKSKNFSSKEYWETRYQKGGNSGAGSYGRLAEFKANVINAFVKEEKIKTVIEFGCGDGNQAKMFEIPQYIGFDVSKKSIQMCSEKFEKKTDRSFFLYDQEAFADYSHFFRVDLTMSLDVIYHLVEDRVFNKYMRDLFDCADKYVMIYASNKNAQKDYQSQHVRHRKFTDWVAKNEPQWKLYKRIKNKYPLRTNEFNESFADFYIFKKK